MSKRFLVLLIIFFSITACQESAPIDNSKMVGSLTMDESGDAEFEEVWTVKANEEGTFFKPMDTGALVDIKVQLGDNELEKVVDLDKESDKSGKFSIMPEGILWHLKKGKEDYKISYKINTFALQTATDQRLFWQFLSNEQVHKPRDIEINLIGPFKKEYTQVRVSGVDGNITYKDDGRYIIKGKNPEFFTLNVTIGDVIFKRARAVKERELTEADAEGYTGEVAPGVVTGESQQKRKPSNVQVDKSKPSQNQKKYTTAMDYSSFIIFGLAVVLLVVYSMLKSKWKKTKEEKEKHYYKSLDELRKEVKNQIETEAPIESIYYSYAFLKSFRVKDFEIWTMVFVMMEMIKAGIFEIEAGVITLLENDESKVRADWKPLWQIMIQAESQEGKITNAEFAKAAKKNKRLLKVFFKEINDRSLDFLLQEGYATDLSQLGSIDRIVLKDYGMVYTTEGEAMALRFARYANFLYYFSTYAEDKDYKVKIWQGDNFNEPIYRLWDNHLMYSMLLGLQGRLSREMEKAYEDYEQEISFNQTIFRNLSMIARRALK